MPAPTFITSYASVYNTSTSPKTVSVTTQAGDVLVVYAAMENGNAPGFSANNPSGNSVTFTPRQTVHIDTGWTDIRLWTGTDSAGGTNWTLSLSANAANGQHWGFTCLVFRSSSGIGASSSTNVNPGAPSLGLTTTQDNSAIVVVNADWNADSSSRTWRTVNSITPTSGNGMETTYYAGGTDYTVYGAYYSDAGTAGAKTVGLSAPTGQKYSIGAVEVKGTTSPATPKIETLTEDFSAGSIDTSKWTSFVGGGSLAQTGGELVNTLPTSPSSGYNYIYSNNAYTLTASSLTVEFTGTISTATGAEQIIQLEMDGNNYMSFFIGGTGIGMRIVTGGVDSSTYGTRDDTNQHWLRIRESIGMLYWEASPDRSTWTVLRTTAVTFSLSTLYVKIAAGTWQAVASPGVATFDNINLETSIFRNTAEGQSDGTTLTAANSGGGSGDAIDTLTTSGTIGRTYSTEQAMFGTRSYKIVPSASSAIFLRKNVASSVYSGSVQMYLYLPAYASTNQIFMQIRSASAAVCDFNVDDTGVVRIGNAAGSNVVTTGSGVFPTAQWIRVDLSGVVGTTTGNGRIIAQLSYLNAFTPFWTYDSGATTNTGTAAMAEYRYGKLDTTPNLSLFYIDNFAWRSNMSAFIPPQSSSPGIAWFIA